MASAAAENSFGSKYLNTWMRGCESVFVFGKNERKNAKIRYSAIEIFD